MEPLIFVLSWERPIYTWVCLDSLYRLTGPDKKVVIADNNSQDPLVRQVIKGFERRGLFHAVHLYDENLPDRFNLLIQEYWDEIGEYFVLIESDIEFMTPGWLGKMLKLMKGNDNLALLGSLVVKSDFVKISEAKQLYPEMSQNELLKLVKGNSPEKKRSVNKNEDVAHAYPPPLRLTMYRKDAYAKIVFGRDVYNSRQFERLGYEVGLSTQVRHRHLTLLNIFDNEGFDVRSRNNFFAHQKKYHFVQFNNLKKVVSILGMHRSGTSCLTGSLQDLGLYLGGVVSAPKEYNPKGTKELKDIQRCQEKVLLDNFSTWKNPSKSYDWSQRQYREMEEILLNEFKDQEIWGFKDPRTLWTVYGWFSLIPRDKIVFVASFRNPHDVASSLLERNSMSYEESLDLWKKYNTQLLELSDEFQIQLINYDVEETDYKQRVKFVYENWIESPASNVVTFADFSRRKRNSFDSSENLPSGIRELHEKLLAKYQNQVDDQNR